MKKAITRFSKDGKTKVVLHVRLSDPCRNGHNDFAFTADVYKKNKRFKQVQQNIRRGYFQQERYIVDWQVVSRCCKVSSSASCGRTGQTNVLR